MTCFIWWYICQSVVPTPVKRLHNCIMYYKHLYGEIRKLTILLYMVFADTSTFNGRLTNLAIKMIIEDVAQWLERLTASPVMQFCRCIYIYTYITYRGRSDILLGQFVTLCGDNGGGGVGYNIGTTYPHSSVRPTSSPPKHPENIWQHILQWANFFCHLVCHHKRPIQDDL